MRHKMQSEDTFWSERADNSGRKSSKTVPDSASEHPRHLPMSHVVH